MELQIPGPLAEPLCRYTPTDIVRVIGWDGTRDTRRIGQTAFDKTKDATCEEFGHSRSHSRKLIHKEGDRFTKERIERRALAYGCGEPWIGMIQYVDEDDAKRPDVGRCSSIGRCDTVVTF